jgi:hypothetical protein
MSEMSHDELSHFLAVAAPLHKDVPMQLTEGCSRDARFAVQPIYILRNDVPRTVPKFRRDCHPRCQVNIPRKLRQEASKYHLSIAWTTPDAFVQESLARIAPKCCPVMRWTWGVPKAQVLQWQTLNLTE